MNKALLFLPTVLLLAGCGSQTSVNTNQNTSLDTNSNIVVNKNVNETVSMTNSTATIANLNVNAAKRPPSNGATEVYTNKDLGFSLTYPRGYVYNSDNAPNVVVFTVEMGGQWVFEVDVVPGQTTLAEAVDNMKSSNSLQKVEDIVVDGQPAKRITMGGEGRYGDTTVLVNNKGKMYTISLGDGSDAELNAMLSSFKFVE